MIDSNINMYIFLAFIMFIVICSYTQLILSCTLLIGLNNDNLAMLIDQLELCPKSDCI